MVDWLKAKIIESSQRIEPITEVVYQRFRELQIEPPTEDRIERLIKSAIASHETDFCNQTLSKLTTQTLAKIDILLTTNDLEDSESGKSPKEKLRTSDFAFFKTDPGAVGLGSFLTEIEKLKRIRLVGLPSDLFSSISAKLIKTYRQRAATEYPYDLRQHQPAVRYTLMAAFCIQRAQEITDSLIEILTTIIKRIFYRAEIVNATFEIRLPHIWGEGTTTCKA